MAALPVAWFAGVRPHPVGGDAVTWEALRRRLATFPTVDAPKRLAPGWAPIRWREGVERRRCSGAVAGLAALVLDFDEGATVDGIVGAASTLTGAWVVHTTWSHTPASPRARLVVPLTEEVEAARWGEVWSAAARWATAHDLRPDAACRDPGRWYLLPGLPADAGEVRRAAARAVVGDGEQRLDAAELVRRWPAPVTASTTPTPTPTPRPRRRATRGEAGEVRRAAGLVAARVAILRGMRAGEPVGRTLWQWARDAEALRRAGLVGGGELDALEAAAAGVLGAAEAARVVRSAVGGAIPGWSWPD